MNIVAFVGIGRLADSSQASAGTVSRPFTAARIVEIAVGYLTIIGFLFYPIGVLVLSLQLWNTYSYSLSDALFAASLVPITSAVGRMLGFLTWAFIAMGITQEIAAAMAMRRVTEEFANSIAPLMSESPREEAVKRQEKHYKVLRLQLFGSAFLVLTAPYALQLILFDSWRTWVLYIAFVTLSCIGGVAAGLLALFTGDSPYPSFIGNWKALLVGYLFGILAGIALTGTSTPSLPLVAFDSAEHKGGRLLAHKEGYWYVFDSQNALRAVSDDAAGNVRFLRNEPQPASR